MDSNSANEASKVIAAMVKSTIMAYVGNARGNIKAGNIGITPTMIPSGWFAPIGVFWRELKATMQTLTRNTSEMPIVNARIAIVTIKVRLVPSKIPTTVFSMIAKNSKYVAKTNEAFT